MHAKVYTSKFYATYNILLHPDCSYCRDRVNRAASHRSVVFVFAEPSGQLYRDMINPVHLSGLLHLDSFIVTRHFSAIYLDYSIWTASSGQDSSLPFIGTYAKTNPTATLTATNHTAGRCI
jgi:hypothetical protein